tara:strand:+ start:294 stop:626 length:333 start_codon:yes stop_codon:yes gene_type:complete
MKNFFKRKKNMNWLSQILLISAPLVGTALGINYLPVYTKPIPFAVPMNKDFSMDVPPPPDLYPKNECNFNTSSNIASKKIKYFTYDCMQPTNNWLLINTPEANYYDVLHK